MPQISSIGAGGLDFFWPTMFLRGLANSQYQGCPGSVRLRFGDGTVQAVPVFGSGGSSAKRVFCVSVQFNRKRRFRFQFRFLENAGKSHLWTNASVGGNFWRTFRTIGPYEFPKEKVWTNDWSI